MQQHNASTSHTAQDGEHPFARLPEELKLEIVRAAMQFDGNGRCSTSFLATRKCFYKDGIKSLYQQPLPIVISADHKHYQPFALKVRIGCSAFSVLEESDYSGVELIQDLGKWPAEIDTRFKRLELRIQDLDLDESADLVCRQLLIFVARIQGRVTSHLDVVVDECGHFLEPLKRLNPSIKLSIRQPDGVDLMPEFERIEQRAVPFLQLITDLDEVRRRSYDFESLLGRAGMRVIRSRHYYEGLYRLSSMLEIRGGEPVRFRDWNLYNPHAWGPHQAGLFAMRKAQMAGIYDGPRFVNARLEAERRIEEMESAKDAACVGLLRETSHASSVIAVHD